MSWHKIAEHVNELEFNEAGIAVAEMSGRKICVARYGEKLFAIAYKCPHAGGMLKDGFVDALGNIVCPLHRYKYNLQNGRNTSGEGYYLKHWPLEEREDGIYVEEKGGLFGWFN